MTHNIWGCTLLACVAGGRNRAPRGGGGGGGAPDRRRRRGGRRDRLRGGPARSDPPGRARPPGPRSASPREALLVRAGPATVALCSLRHGGRSSHVASARGAPRVDWTPGKARLATPVHQASPHVRGRPRARDRGRSAPRSHPPPAGPGNRAPDRRPRIRRPPGRALTRAVPRAGAPPRGACQGASAGSVVRGRRGELDRGRGAVPGADRAAAFGALALRP